MSLAAELERALHYPQGDALPPPGGALALAAGIKWVRIQLPFALDHINLWLLRDRLDGREGWTVVDCCIDRPESRADWEQVFASEMDGLPVLRVLVTHMHPDHVGLAHWLCERWSSPEHECRLWISGTDYLAARYASEVVNSFGGERQAAHFRRHGLTNPDELEQLRQRKSYYRNLVPALPPSYARLIDGGQIIIGGHAWRCIAGYGHAPEHMALYCEPLNVLISGDMVLPRISTNVSVYEMEPEADALRLFLDSIDRFKPLPADTLVLPSHGKPFNGLHTRIQQLHEHHRDRLAEVMAAARERPVSAYDVLPVLFKRPLDLHQTTFALGEAVAHLHRLWFSGRLRRTRDAQGVWRFGAVH
ncbi:MBL fold metallo-hydrolase [Ottowia sp.]|uniref:MBL fold metallo-hydrolase n=1 Tax=Ottowia sp. TaxID=1898956 RepID=UPI003A8ABD4E